MPSWHRAASEPNLSVRESRREESRSEIRRRERKRSRSDKASGLAPKLARRFLRYFLRKIMIRYSRNTHLFTYPSASSHHHRSHLSLIGNRFCAFHHFSKASNRLIIFSRIRLTATMLSWASSHRNHPHCCTKIYRGSPNPRHRSQKREKAKKTPEGNSWSLQLRI